MGLSDNPSENNSTKTQAQARFKSPANRKYYGSGWSANGAPLEPPRKVRPPVPQGITRKAGRKVCKKNRKVGQLNRNDTPSGDETGAVVQLERGLG